MLKTIIKLGILLLILNALWQVVPPYWRYTQFKTAVNHLALRAGTREPAQLVDAVMELAAENGVPVERDNIQVRTERNRTYIDVVYVDSAEPVPGWRVTRSLEVHADALKF